MDRIGSNILLYQGDCLEEMNKIPDGSVDMVLTDPPYGTTACKWDSVIPFDMMWEQIKRVSKESSSALLFGSEPFSTKLRVSNLDWYKYDWYWVKSKPSLYQHAKNRPMKAVETISVFSQAKWGHKSQVKNRMNYYPQGVKSIGEKVVTKNFNAGGVGSERPNQVGKVYEAFTGFPNDVIYFPNVIGKNAIHSTQKPVPLLEYLIHTYTKEGEVVLDFTMGSGSTGVACVNTGRKFIGIELDEEYYGVAKKRIEKCVSRND